MQNPLQCFKNKLYKNIVIYDKVFTLNPYIKINNLSDKVKILSDAIVSINNIPIIEIDSVKENINKGFLQQNAIIDEINSWDSKITNILFLKFIEILKQKQNINFEDYEDLRIYWKIRKIFSKEEVDNWSDIEWNWAIYNIYKDDLELDKIDDRKLEKRKPWYNAKLYSFINNQKDAEKRQQEEQKDLIKLMLKKENLSDIDFEIVEKQDIPTILEEK